MNGPVLPGPFADRPASTLRVSGGTAGLAFTLRDEQATPETAIVETVCESVLLHFPAPSPCGTAILVIAGGGYVELMAGREGVAIAHWLNNLGIDAHVLIHRFPDARSGVTAALDDAVAAMAVLRRNLAVNILGVLGLSSGGHLAACLLARADTARPDFAIIGYAPISTNAAGRAIIPNKPPLEPPQKQAFYDAHQPDSQMAPGAPATFIVYSASDPIVPAINGYRLAQAVERAGGQVDLHIFAQAPHGFATDTPDIPVSLWPALCAAWLRQIGALKGSPS